MTEAQDITYLKFVDTPQIVTPVATDHSHGVWATYEVVNIGTAPTTGEDEVSVAVCYHGVVVHSGSHTFDDPVLEANGGSHKGNVHVGMELLPYPGDWEMVIQINRPGVGEGISDVVHLPFTVQLARDD